MRLYLVQHGQAEVEEIDPQRHLTADGAKEVEKVAAFLRPLGLKAPAIWHSGKPRAQETAEIMARVLWPRARVSKRSGLNPSDPLKPIRQAVARSRNDLMIVGHLPFLSKLVARLLTGSKSSEVVCFQYAGVVCLERDDKRGWKLRWMVVPELLSPRP
jgi:phosphohistidine phosphatase